MYEYVYAALCSDSITQVNLRSGGFVVFPFDFDMEGLASECRHEVAHAFGRTGAAPAYLAGARVNSNWQARNVDTHAGGALVAKEVGYHRCQAVGSVRI